jgi:membrane-associated phospholipid phosphatase
MRYLGIGRIITLIIACVILCISFAIGKIRFFLMLNTDLGKAADYFFAAFTYLGNGIMWIAVLVITLYLLKRKQALLLLVSSFIITTILTQLCKYFIFSNEPRPVTAIADHTIIHFVNILGQEPAAISSFPSGHTATAFTFYLLFCVLINRKWWVFTGLIYALLAGYSRIYLAQHFPVDVAAGMIVATVSVSISLLIQREWNKRRRSPE